MILGVGVDLVRISRMEGWRRCPGLLRRFFHPDELAVALAQEGPREPSPVAAALAARFAAKEAFGKALGTGMRGLRLRDIAVVAAPSGQPRLALWGTARRALQQAAGRRVLLSLSHDGDYAVAFVILEDRRPL